MGRLSTAVASAGVDAGNLPEKLPNISLIDALLPASWSSRSSRKDKVRAEHRVITCTSPTLLPDEQKNRMCSIRNDLALVHHVTWHHITSPSRTTQPRQHPLNLEPTPPYHTMPFFITPLFRKPFKLFAIDADTGQPLDANVRKKTRVTYYELQNGSNGSKKLVAHKSASEVAKAAEANNGSSKQAEGPKQGEGVEPNPETKAGGGQWTAEQDETLRAMKKEGKSWAMIVAEIGRSKHELQVRWKEINHDNAQCKNEVAGKKDAGGGGEQQGQQGQDGKGGNGHRPNQNQNQHQHQGQGKGKNKNKNKNGQNNNQSHNGGGGNHQPNTKQEAEKKQTNDQTHVPNKPASNKPASNKPPAKPAAEPEARFTMHDWLTLQEDDLFSFGELQCLSELIAQDMNQGWQRIAAKFFDLTGRRVHPDDVREKFESMAMVGEGV